MPPSPPSGMQIEDCAGWLDRFVTERGRPVLIACYGEGKYVAMSKLHELMRNRFAVGRTWADNRLAFDLHIVWGSAVAAVLKTDKQNCSVLIVSPLTVPPTTEFQ